MKILSNSLKAKFYAELAAALQPDISTTIKGNRGLKFGTRNEALLRRRLAAMGWHFVHRHKGVVTVAREGGEWPINIQSGALWVEQDNLYFDPQIEEVVTYFQYHEVNSAGAHVWRTNRPNIKAATALEALVAKYKGDTKLVLTMSVNYIWLTLTPATRSAE